MLFGKIFNKLFSGFSRNITVNSNKFNNVKTLFYLINLNIKIIYLKKRK